MASKRKLKSGEKLITTRSGRVVVERELSFAGYVFRASPEGTQVQRSIVDLTVKGDYGADPLGDGTFRMVPSGDIVDLEEYHRRLRKR